MRLTVTQILKANGEMQSASRSQKQAGPGLFWSKSGALVVSEINCPFVIYIDLDDLWHFALYCLSTPGLSPVDVEQQQQATHEEEPAPEPLHDQRVVDLTGDSGPWAPSPPRQYTAADVNDLRRYQAHKEEQRKFRYYTKHLQFHERQKKQLSELGLEYSNLFVEVRSFVIAFHRHNHLARLLMVGVR
jgi:hypothetical protein